MPAEGGDPVVLLEAEWGVESPAWRPDNDRIVYRSSSDDNVRNLWQVSASDPVPEQLTSLVGMWTGGHSVSNDGRIAYSATWHDTILTTYDIESQRTVALTSHTQSNFGPRFSPDGRSIAYQSDRTGDNEIWVHDLDGKEHRITKTPGEDMYPDWSPDGKRLVFVSDRDGSPRIYVADLESGNIRPLQEHEGIALDAGAGRDSMSARWSPRSSDEELIGYIVSSDEGRSLWGIAPDAGAPAHELLEDVAGFDWYLDSRRVVCTLDEGRAEELVVVDLETGERNTLWKGPHAEIDVSPDGKFVMFCKGLGHLNMGLATLELVPPEEPNGLPTARGEPKDIVRPEGRWHVHHGGWGPDSKSVVYVHDADRANIYELVEQR
jgi:Tol biopolymer transport system component